MRHMLERIETALVGVTDPVERRRRTVYRLRAMGYTLESVAEELNISYGTAHGDEQWCHANLPAAYANAEEFRRISIPQLEYLYQLLVTPRIVLETTDGGETIERLELPGPVAIRTAASVKAEQSKLLGAYRSVSVDDGGDTVTYTLTVTKPRFDIEGAATEQESIEEHA